MVLFKVRALYDFYGEPNTAEISIVAGEILSVTRIDIGEGWWEGINSKNESGLFPEAYVEKIVEPAGPPSIPPPALPAQVNDWGDNNQQQHHDDDWDDEWDNDDAYSEIQNTPKEQIYANELNQNQFNYTNSNNADNVSEVSYNIDNRGAVTKKSLNRFSTYVKSGLESYILGTLKEFPSQQRFQIFRENDNVYQWQIIRSPYTVQVTSPKKATKMGGLKSFIAYQLTPSFTGVEVSRRYKHFDWLHNRLSEKFNVLAIPPLPDKQISGRYEEHFVEHRRVQLQEFVNYVCRHPVMSMCEVWKHFLTCTDEKQWKEGKRKAEKDQLIGANFCLCIDAPEKDLLQSTVDSKMEVSINYINFMDQSIKQLMQMAVEQQKKCDTMYKREFMKIGENFFALGSAFDMGARAMFSDLSMGINEQIMTSKDLSFLPTIFYAQYLKNSTLPSEYIKKIGATYIAIAKLYEEQAAIDWRPLADKLYLYRGITSSFPDIFSMQKHAEQKKKECEKTQMVHTQLNEVRKRTDVLTYAVFAELDHFETEMKTEFRSAMKTFLQDQVNFYKNIVSNLEETLKRFE